MSHRLLRLAFIAGPLLMVTASLVFAAGVGLSPNNASSYVEGIIGSYGIVAFIPIYWELSRRLSESKKLLGAVTYVTGLLGTATGFTHMYSRVFEYELRRHGAGEEVWSSFYTNPGGELLSVALLGPLFPLTSVLLGIGFLLVRTLPAWMSVSLIVAGLLFPAAMISVSPLLLKTAYPLACLLWAAAFGNYAFRFNTVAALR